MKYILEKSETVFIIRPINNVRHTSNHICRSHTKIVYDYVLLSAAYDKQSLKILLILI